jgi:hypothetical protein
MEQQNSDKKKDEKRGTELELGGGVRPICRNCLK